MYCSCIAKIVAGKLFNARLQDKPSIYGHTLLEPPVLAWNLPLNSITANQFELKFHS